MRERTVQSDGLITKMISPQEELIRVAKENVGWDYSQEVTTLYNRSQEVLDRFYPQVHTPQWQGKLPPIVFGVENLRNANTLAAYYLIPDSVGLPFKISFNEQHYINKDGRKQWRFGEWAKMETLVHEIGHHWQQLLGDDPFTPKSRVTHNREFRGKLEQIGLHCDSDGAHFAPVEKESPAGILFTEWGLTPPRGVPEGKALEFDWIKWFAKEQGKERKGGSTLHKYSCECGCNIRVSVKDWPGAECNKCHTQYVKAEPRPRK